MFILIKVCLLVYCIQDSMSQLQNYFQNPMNQGFYQEQIPDYPEDYEQTKHRHHRKPYGSSGGVLPQEEYEEPDYNSEESKCRCSCRKCSDIKSCCREYCLNCYQPNIMYVPYAYPIIMPEVTSPNTQATTTTEATTTTKATTTAATTTGVLDYRRNDVIDFNDIISQVQNKNSESKFLLTSLRKTKANWIPKYGIVPIPDHLAERLMSQMRSMKNINNHK